MSYSKSPQTSSILLGVFADPNTVAATLPWISNLITILNSFFSSSQWYNSNLHIPSLSQFPGQVPFFFFFFNFLHVHLVVCWYSHVHNLSDPLFHFFFIQDLLDHIFSVVNIKIPEYFFMIFFLQYNAWFVFIPFVYMVEPKPVAQFPFYVPTLTCLFLLSSSSSSFFVL